MSEALLDELGGPLISVVAVNSCPGNSPEDIVSDVFSYALRRPGERRSAGVWPSDLPHSSI